LPTTLRSAPTFHLSVRPLYPETADDLLHGTKSAESGNRISPDLTYAINLSREHQDEWWQLVTRATGYSAATLAIPPLWS
jgi:hypothetical protein